MFCIESVEEAVLQVLNRLIIGRPSQWFQMAEKNFVATKIERRDNAWIVTNVEANVSFRTFTCLAHCCVILFLFYFSHLYLYCIIL